MNRAAYAIVTAMLFVGAPGAADVMKMPEDREKAAFVQRLVKAANLNLDIRVVTDPDTTFCAYATMAGGQHYIAVNPSCVGAPVEEGRYSPIAVGVLAHEIGHVALGHTVSVDSDDDAKLHQLAADQFSGRLVATLGGSLTEAQAFVTMIGEHPTSPREPERAERIAAVEKGWNEAAPPGGVSNQTWASGSGGSGEGPLGICWNSFLLGCVCTFVVISFISRR